VNRKDNTNQRQQKPSDGREPFRSPRPQFGRQLLIWALVISAVVVGLSLYKRTRTPAAKTVDLIAFRDHVLAGDVEQLVIKGLHATAILRDKTSQYTSLKTLLPTEGYLDQNISEWMQHLPQGREDALKIENDHEVWPFIAMNVVPLLLLILLMVYFFQRQMRLVNPRDGGLPFLKSNVRQVNREKVDVTFDDVAGVDEAKEELQETIEFLKNPDKFRGVGARIPRGVLLVGYPGTGKTLLAKAVAGEAGVPFFSLCGSDFVELFVGVGAARVRDLFQRARDNHPCIIFLDEIDAVGRKRGTGLGGGHDEREQTLNAILSEMDGFTPNEGVIVMAATNRADVLDPALLRPGRFDREVMIDLPDVKGRQAILKVHARKVKMAPNVGLEVVARGSPGFSGADLEAVVNEAAILASAKGKKAVEMDDLEESRDKVRFGRRKTSRIMTDEDRKMTAYHEAGHALVATLHPDMEPLHKVTIIPRGPSLGMTMILPEQDKYSLRKQECLGWLATHMAGRVSEGLFCNDISSGAKNDIEMATNLARKMVTQWGMSEKIGPVCYSDEEEHIFLGTEITRAKKHGEHVSQQIDEEIQAFLSQAHEKATQMCQEHREQLHALANALLKLETLTAEEVKRVLAGDSIEELKAVRESAKAKVKAEQADADRESTEGRAIGDLPAPAESPA